MNERIQELIQKMDWEEMGADLWGKTHDGCMTTYALKKFAELIVQECVQAFEAEVDTWNEMEPYQGIIKRKGTQAIKQHFGVE